MYILWSCSIFSDDKLKKFLLIGSENLCVYDTLQRSWTIPSPLLHSVFEGSLLIATSKHLAYLAISRQKSTLQGQRYHIVRLTQSVNNSTFVALPEIILFYETRYL